MISPFPFFLFIGFLGDFPDLLLLKQSALSPRLIALFQLLEHFSIPGNGSPSACGYKMTNKLHWPRYRRTGAHREDARKGRKTESGKMAEGEKWECEKRQRLIYCGFCAPHRLSTSAIPAMCASVSLRARSRLCATRMYGFINSGAVANSCFRPKNRNRTFPFELSSATFYRCSKLIAVLSSRVCARQCMRANCITRK